MEALAWKVETKIDTLALRIEALALRMEALFETQLKDSPGLARINLNNSLDSTIMLKYISCLLGSAQTRRSSCASFTLDVSFLCFQARREQPCQSHTGSVRLALCFEANDAF